MNPESTQNIEHYGSLFSASEADLSGGASSTVHAVRQAALEALRREGFPTRHDEAWRHTNPAPLLAELYRPTGKISLTESGLSDWSIEGLGDGPLLVFVNGQFDEAHSRLTDVPDGVQIQRLSEAIANKNAHVAEHLGKIAQCEDGGFAALNTAFVDDGALVSLDPSTLWDVPVEILYITRPGPEPTLVTPRTSVIAGDGSQVQFVESFVTIGEGDHLTTPVTEIWLGVGAQVEHTRLQIDTDQGHHTSSLFVREGEDARFTSHSIGLGGKLVRNDVTTFLAGERIVSTLNGLFLSRGQEHVDNYTSIEHAAPNCESHELYKGILADKSNGVFRGKIHVHQIAQQTDAYQSNQNLLIGDDAGIMSKPQLEIYADDVKCSHGSTTGELDDEAIFYLRARGIGEATARGVLTRAFADELVDCISHEAIRSHVDALVTLRLEQVLKSESGS
jgi:Fe-S cluster assembly protein SufD